MNPTIDRGVSGAGAACGIRSRSRREYEANFRRRRPFLDPVRIDEAVLDRGELSPGQAHRWVAGLDPAFSSDPFGLAIVGLDPSRRGGGWCWARRGGGCRSGGGLGLSRRDGWSRIAVLEEVARAVPPLPRDARSRISTRRPVSLERLPALGVTVRVEPMTAQSKTDAFQELRGRLTPASSSSTRSRCCSASSAGCESRYTAGAAPRRGIPRVGGSHGDLRRRSRWPCTRWRSCGRGRAASQRS